MKSWPGVLFRSIWLAALFWPYAHAGGLADPAAMALAPIIFSLGDFWPRWPGKIIYWFLALLGQFFWQWSSLTSWHGRIGGLVGLPWNRLPVDVWHELNAHLAAPLLLVGAFLGWLAFRGAHDRSRIMALLVTGTVVLPIDHVFWGLTAQGPLAVYLAVGLGLLAQEHLDQLARRTGTPLSLLHKTVPAGIALLPVLAGWATHPHRAADPGHLFANWRPRAGIASPGFLPGRQRIGQSITPSQKPAYFIQARYPAYWQVAIYNSFDGRSWFNPQSSPPYTIPAELANLPLFPPPFEHVGTVEMTAHVTALGSPITTLLYTGVPTRFSIPVTYHPVASRFTTVPLTDYSLEMVVPLFNPAQLAADPASPPAPSVFSPDLQLPGNLSPRVARLARRITAGQHGIWARAMAVKDYLDRHYRYSYSVTRTKTDVVNHFLFRDKMGYCDQFSTAFIMMMRALGIPSRWVVGYGPGTYEPSRNGYLLRAIDAHSWAQVYVAPYGWVPIDPTPGWHIPVPAAASLPVVAENTRTPATPSPASEAARPPVSSHSSKVPASASPAPKSRPLAKRRAWLAIGIGGFFGVTAAAFIFRKIRRGLHRPHSWRLMWRAARWWTIWRLRRTLPLGLTPRSLGQIWVDAGLADPMLAAEFVRTVERAFYGPVSPPVADRIEAWRVFHRIRAG